MLKMLHSLFETQYPKHTHTNWSFSGKLIHTCLSPIFPHWKTDHSHSLFIIIHMCTLSHIEGKGPIYSYYTLEFIRILALDTYKYVKYSCTFKQLLHIQSAQVHYGMAQCIHCRLHYKVYHMCTFCRMIFIVTKHTLSQTHTHWQVERGSVVWDWGQGRCMENFGHKMFLTG